MRLGVEYQCSTTACEQMRLCAVVSDMLRKPMIDSAAPIVILFLHAAVVIIRRAPMQSEEVQLDEDDAIKSALGKTFLAPLTVATSRGPHPHWVHERNSARDHHLSRSSRCGSDGEAGVTRSKLNRCVQEVNLVRSKNMWHACMR